jgi:hypothetical protein
MKSIVAIEINVPKEKLAALFADPDNNIQWMDDLERFEHISGEPGMPGSKYRLVPKAGQKNMDFIATVTARNLPDESRLLLEASNVVVSVKGTFTGLSPDRTKLISEEIFTFRGLFNKMFGFLAQRVIKKAHRRHMESFKRFAEDRGKATGAINT